MCFVSLRERSRSTLRKVARRMGHPLHGQGNQLLWFGPRHNRSDNSGIPLGCGYVAGWLPGVGNAGLFSDVPTGQKAHQDLRLFRPAGAGSVFRLLSHGLRSFDRLRASCGLQSFAAHRLAQGRFRGWGVGALRVLPCAATVARVRSALFFVRNAFSFVLGSFGHGF